MPAGERWSDSSFRPAFEDLIGAGAIISHLTPQGWSPEAEASVDAFRGAADRFQEKLKTCVSGRELIDAGFEQDVAIAAELNVSTSVPRFNDGAYAAI